MADRYWVGGNANWDATAGTKWATTSGGAGGAAVPTAADDVYLDNGAGTGNVSITAAAACRSLNCTGYVNTLAMGTTLAIGHSTAGAGNIALKFVAGMTFTPAGNVISFVSTSATVQTVDWGGKTTSGITFSGATGSWQFVSAHTVSSGYFTFTGGTLDLNGQTCSWYWISSNTTAARTLIPGASSITHNGNGTSPYIVSTGLTITANTATVTFTGNNTFILAGAGTDFNGMSMVANGASLVTWTGTFTGINDFTRSTPASKVCAVGFAGSLTITGTLTLGGDSSVNRLLVYSNTIGTAATLNAATVAISNADFQDITGAGAGSWNLSAITGLSGDCGGNSGITFTTPATQTRNSTGVRAWSDATSSRWTSRVPLPQDDVIINGTTTGTTQCDMPRLGKSIDFTGHTGTVAQNIVANTVFGSLTLASGMTLTSTQTMTLGGRGTHTITAAGKSFGSTVTFNSFGGTYTFQDAFTSAGRIDHNNGSIDLNSQTITVQGLWSLNPTTRAITGGTATINITSTFTMNVYIGTPSGMTQSLSDTTVVLATASTNQRDFVNMGTVGTLVYNVADSPGIMYIRGSAMSFAGFDIGPGRNVQFQSGLTYTVRDGTQFDVNGVNNGYLYLPGISGNYLSTPDSTALSITGDIDLIARIAPNDWTPSAEQVIISKYPAGGNLAFIFRISSAGGLLDLLISQNGSAATSAVSSVGTGFTDGTTQWVRATWRQSDGRVQFFTAADSSSEPGSWTQLGTDKTIALASIFDSTGAVEVGSRIIGALAANMKVYRAIIKDGIAGTVAFDADLTTKPFGADTFTESSSNAATVTINGALAQVGDGRVSIYTQAAGSAATISVPSGVVYGDYLSLKDSSASGGASFVARASTNVSGNTGWAFPVTAVAVGGNWSSTSTWDSGVVPTAATDVALISTSGQVTIDVNAVCRSIDCTGYTATLTQNSSTVFSIGTSTAGAGNIALKFVAGMTYTPLGSAGSASITFISTSTTVQTINFAGKATSGVVINGVGSNYQCTGSWAHTDLNAFTHLTAGTLDLNGQTCTWGTVEIKGTGVKVLAMGSSAISMSRSSVAAWWYSGSNLTVSANTAVITLTGTGAGIRADSTIDWNGLSVVMNAYGNTFTGNQTFGNITKTGTATKLEYLTLAGNITCTGAFTVNGNSVTNRVLVKSSVVGTARTITAATVSTSNSDWRDIAGAGAGSWNLAAITGLSGDCGGNSGITFTSPTTQTATGTSSFTWSTHGWTSRVPLPQDTASIPNAFTAGQTITMDMPRCGAVSFVGSTGNVAFSAAAAIEIHGSLTLRASMGTFSASSLYFIGPSTHNLTTAGNTLAIASYIQLWRSAVSLQDDLTNSLSGIYAPSGCIGNIVTNNFNLTCTLIQLQTMTPTSPHQFGSSTVTLTLQSSTVVLGFVSAAAVSAAPATFVVNGAPAARSVLLSGASIGALTFTSGVSSLPLTITGASTIGTLTIGGGRTLSLPSGLTTTVSNFVTTSNANGYVYLAGGSGNYASTPDSAALSMTSDIDIRCKVALDSWSSGAIQTLVAKFVFATPNASYWFGVDGTGHLQFSSSSDGTAGTVINSVSTVVTGLSAGTVKWVRGTFQPNDGAGHNVAKFYTSNDGSNWTQLGSTVTNNGAALIFDSTAPLEIGSDNVGTNVVATGKFYNAQVRNNILDNGTGIVFDANFGAKPVGSNTFTESSSNGATVTINGSQAQVGDGRVGLNATTPGSAATLSKASGLVSCNYMSIQDSTATGGAQWYAGAASLNISNNSGWIFSTARDGSFLDFF